MPQRPMFLNPFSQRRSPINKASQRLVDFLTEAYKVNRQQAATERVIDFINKGDYASAAEQAVGSNINPTSVIQLGRQQKQRETQQNLAEKKFTQDRREATQETQQTQQRYKRFNNELMETMQNFEERTGQSVEEVGVNPPLLDPGMSGKQMNDIVVDFQETLRETQEGEIDLTKYNKRLLNFYNTQFDLGLSDKDIEEQSRVLAEQPGLMRDFLSDLTQQRQDEMRVKSEFPMALDDIRQVVETGKPITRGVLKSIARDRNLQSEDDIRNLLEYTSAIRTQNEAKLRRQFHNHLLSDKGLPALIKNRLQMGDLSKEQQEEAKQEILQQADVFFGGMMEGKNVQNIVQNEMKSFGIQETVIPQQKNRPPLNELYDEIFGDE